MPASATRRPFDSAFTHVIRSLRRHKTTVIITSSLAMLSFVALLSTVTLKYTAEATILIDTNRVKMATIKSSTLEDQHNLDETALQNAIQSLQSKTLALKAIDALDLRSDPAFNPAIADHGSLHNAIHDFIVINHDRLPPVIYDFLLPRFAPDLSGNLDDLIAQGFLGNLHVRRDGKSQRLIIGFTNKSRDRAAQLANTYTELFVAELADWRADDIAQVSKWISLRLGELNQDLKIAEEKEEAYRREHKLIEGKEGRPAAQQITEFNTQLVMAKTGRDNAIAKLREAENYVAQGELEAIAEIQSAPVIQQLRMQETQVMRRLAEISTDYGERHPLLTRTRAELKEVRQKIATEVQRILQTMRNNVAVGDKGVAQATALVGQASAYAGQDNQATVKLRALSREAANARTLLDAFLTHSINTTQSKFQVTEAQIRSRAIPPSSSNFPNLILVLLIGGIASLGVGGTTALVAAHRNNGFRSMEEIESELGVPALSLIPETKDACSLPVLHPSSVYVERLRELYFPLSSNPHSRVVLFTSSVSEEGKTTLAVSFAKTLALAQRRVILLDCDLRNPSANKALGVPNEPGLCDVFAETSDLQATIIVDEKTGLHFLPAGETKGIPAFQFLHTSMQQIIDFLRMHYDIIIIDSPPLLPVTDTKFLAPLVDQAIVTVHWEKTPRELVRHSVRMLLQAGVPAIGVAMNRVIHEKHASYGFSESAFYYNKKHDKYYKITAP